MALNSLLEGLKGNLNLSVLKLDGVEWRDLRFPNEESYRGGWKDSRPEGEGCYTWADNSTYEGAWHAGLKHGWGKYRWPNGAWYQGEWRDGLMQGYGTFESPDGARYVGNWAANLKHGIGKKTYANGDSYEGLWCSGKAEGPGRYVWHHGNQYDGEWRAGKMHGQGTLKWVTGERYDGEWSEGQENGVGVFTWRDGSTYEGFWEGGKKTGVGVFRPAPRAPGALPSNEAVARPAARVPGEDGNEAAAPRSPVGSPTAADAPLDSPAAAAAAQHRLDLLAPDARSSHAAGVGGAGSSPAEQLVFVCAYEAGKLLHEEALSMQDLELIFGPGKAVVEKRRRLRRGRRRQVRMGETIYKGHRSYDLMLNLQLGIRYTITTLNKLPPPKSIGEAHFREKVWLKFPREGSEVTPPHPSGDFKWKDYCPTAFKHLRGLFGIDNSQYILSICGDQALREMPSPGKSGSVFFISHDDQFMIKTMHKEEIKLLLSMLPKYMRHVERNPETLLTRFYGVHRVKPSHGRKVRFVVMNNVFRTDLDLHRKYDLKGSTHGRTAGPRPGPTAIRKDLDLDAAFHTEAKTRAKLLGQLAADCTFLEDIRVMDYSLLMGVHCRSRGDTSASALNTDKEDNTAFQSAEEAPDEGTEADGEDGESEDGAFVELESGAGGSGSSWLHSLQSGSGPSEPSARNLVAAGSSSRLRGRPSSGLAVAPTSDSDAEVTHSMHSMTIEQQSPRESRSPSFLLKGLTWRSFTQRRASEPQLAPASALHPIPTQLPVASAQITPRVQPSVVPTPRLAAAGAPAAPAALASSNSRPLQPPAVPPAPGFAEALRAAAAQEGSAASGRASAAVAAAAASPADSVQAPQANGHAPPALQEEQHRQQNGLQPPTQDQQEEENGPLISWRSDAVQLPEQMLLPDGLPASPTGSAGAAAGTSQDAAASLTARTRGGTAPALGSILEAPGSGREAEEEEHVEGQQPGGQQAAGAAAAAPPLAVPADSRSPPPAAGFAPSPAAPSDSAASTPVSSLAGTPTAAAGPRSGLPLPGGMPRLPLAQHTPQSAVLQPQRESGDWLQYAESVSNASASLGTHSEQRSVGRQQQHGGGGAVVTGGTPDSDAGSHSAPLARQRRRTAPPLMGSPGQGVSRGSGDLSAALAAVSISERRGLVSAPATARSPLPTPTAGAAGQQQQQHRLAQAAGPGDASPAVSPPLSPHMAAAVAAHAGASPLSSRSHTGGLARTTSAPASALAAGVRPAAGAEERRRSGLQHPRGLSMAAGREASMVDLTSPEAVALQGRIHSRLSRRVTDRLVQDLLKLARYRMVGAVAHSPSARAARMPTTVLAARHMRRTSSGGEGGGGGRAARRERDALSSSLDDEGTPGPVGAADDGLLPAGRPGSSGDGAPPPLRLGMRLPAVAVSQQAGQQPEQVLLYFGIIDFLQEYNMRKMLEHGLKAVVQDGKAISVVEPRTYAKRFLRFMDRVFPTPPAPAPQPQQHGQQQQQQQDHAIRQQG
ncbi:hypothetical protein ABPG75_007144 [Micractinium tetrahymenae]